MGNKKDFSLTKHSRALIKLFLSLVAVISLAGFLYVLYFAHTTNEERVSVLALNAIELGAENAFLKERLAENIVELDSLKKDDQYQINLALRQKIADIERTYGKAVSVYEELLKLKEIANNTKAYDGAYTKSLTFLANQNYEEADKALNDLRSQIATEHEKVVASFSIPANVPTNNAPPESGYSRQQVATSVGTFLVSMVAADLSSTRVIVDTATNGDCSNDCPVLPLSEYVARNNAFAGVNGTYFCPADYPSCAGKTNTFDLLVMNKDKTYINSGNNVYSSNPAFIFSGGSARFVGQVQEWGRDTGVDSVISNFPTLVQGGNVAFAGDADPKKGSKGARSFVANKGGKVYIGVVSNVTVVENAHVMKALGMENAMNLDSGGSTALWSGGYKFGPGRNLPNVLLFVRR